MVRERKKVCRLV